MLQQSSEFNKQTNKRNKMIFFIRVVNSRLSRCGKARGGSNTWFFLVGPTKFKACKSIISLYVSC